MHLEWKKWVCFFLKEQVFWEWNEIIFYFKIYLKIPNKTYSRIHS